MSQEFIHQTSFLSVATRKKRTEVTDIEFLRRDALD
jgi:hypothetical protein